MPRPYPFRYCLLSSPLLLAACGTAKPALETTLPPPAPAVAGTMLKEPHLESVRKAEAVHAYPVGRYEDPEDSTLMHEAHTVYRAESEPTWNLNPNVPTVVPLGPVVAVADPAKQNVALTAELEQKIREQNDLLRATAEQNERLAKDLADLQQLFGLGQKAIADKERLEREVADRQTELDAARQKLSLQEKTAAAKEAARAPAKSWWQFWQ